MGPLCVLKFFESNLLQKKKEIRERLRRGEINNS